VVQQHVKIKVELVTPERTPTGAIEIEPGVIEHGATLIPFEPPLACRSALAWPRNRLRGAGC
jgi:hypothetical protein